MKPLGDPHAKFFIDYADESFFPDLSDPSFFHAVVNSGTPKFSELGLDHLVRGSPLRNPDNYSDLLQLMASAGDRDPARNTVKVDVGFCSESNMGRDSDSGVSDPRMHRHTMDCVELLLTGTKLAEIMKHPFAARWMQIETTYGSLITDADLALATAEIQMACQRIRKCQTIHPQNRAESCSALKRDDGRKLKHHFDHNNSNEDDKTPILGFTIGNLRWLPNKNKSVPRDSSEVDDLNSTPSSNDTRMEEPPRLAKEDLIALKCHHNISECDWSLNEVTPKPAQTRCVWYWKASLDNHLNRRAACMEVYSRVQDYLDNLRDHLHVLTHEDVPEYLEDFGWDGYMLLYDTEKKEMLNYCLLSQASRNKNATFQSALSEGIRSLNDTQGLSEKQVMELLYVAGTVTQFFHFLIVLKHWEKVGVPQGVCLMEAFFECLSQFVECPAGGAHSRSQPGNNRSVPKRRYAAGLQAFSRALDKANSDINGIKSDSIPEKMEWVRTYRNNICKSCISFGPLKAQQVMASLAQLTLLDAPELMEVTIASPDNALFRHQKITEAQIFQYQKSAAIRFGCTISITEADGCETHRLFEAVDFFAPGQGIILNHNGRAIRYFFRRTDAGSVIVDSEYVEPIECNSSPQDGKAPNAYWRSDYDQAFEANDTFNPHSYSHQDDPRYLVLTKYKQELTPAQARFQARARQVCVGGYSHREAMEHITKIFHEEAPYDVTAELRAKAARKAKRAPAPKAANAGGTQAAAAPVPPVAAAANAGVSAPPAAAPPVPPTAGESSHSDHSECTSEFELEMDDDSFALITGTKRAVTGPSIATSKRKRTTTVSGISDSNIPSVVSLNGGSPTKRTPRSGCAPPLRNTQLRNHANFLSGVLKDSPYLEALVEPSYLPPFKKLDRGGQLSVIEVNTDLYKVARILLNVLALHVSSEHPTMHQVSVATKDHLNPTSIFFKAQTQHPHLYKSQFHFTSAKHVSGDIDSKKSADFFSSYIRMGNGLDIAFSRVHKNKYVDLLASRMPMAIKASSHDLGTGQHHFFKSKDHARFFTMGSLIMVASQSSSASPFCAWFSDEFLGGVTGPNPRVVRPNVQHNDKKWWVWGVSQDGWKKVDGDPLFLFVRCADDDLLRQDIYFAIHHPHNLGKKGKEKAKHMKLCYRLFHSYGA